MVLRGSAKFKSFAPERGSYNLGDYGWLFGSKPSELQITAGNHIAPQQSDPPGN